MHMPICVFTVLLCAILAYTCPTDHRVWDRSELYRAGDKVMYARDGERTRSYVCVMNHSGVVPDTNKSAWYDAGVWHGTGNPGPSGHNGFQAPTIASDARNASPFMTFVIIAAFTYLMAYFLGPLVARRTRRINDVLYRMIGWVL